MPNAVIATHTDTGLLKTDYLADLNRAGYTDYYWSQYRSDAGVASAELLDAQCKQQIRLILRILQTGESSSKQERPYHSPHRKTSPDLQQFQEQPRAKWDEQLDMSTLMHLVATPLVWCQQGHMNRVL